MGSSSYTLPRNYRSYWVEAARIFFIVTSDRLQKVAHAKKTSSTTAMHETWVVDAEALCYLRVNQTFVAPTDTGTDEYWRNHDNIGEHTSGRFMRSVLRVVLAKRRACN